MFTDIKSELNTPKQRQPFDGISFTEILFADDTLIFGANTHCINVLLHAIERHSAYFGLKLNYNKCINLTANQRISSVRFSPNGPAAGALVPRKSSATYLGTLLTDSFNNKAEVANRLNDCIATCNRLKLFWKRRVPASNGKSRSSTPLLDPNFYIVLNAFNSHRRKYLN